MTYSIDFRIPKNAKFYLNIKNCELTLIPDKKMFYYNDAYPALCEEVDGTQNVFRDWEYFNADPDDILYVQDAYNGNYDAGTHQYGSTTRGVDHQLAHEICIESDSHGYAGGVGYSVSDPNVFRFIYSGPYYSWLSKFDSDQYNLSNRSIYTKQSDLSFYDKLHEMHNLVAVHYSCRNDATYNSTITNDMFQQAADWTFEYFDNLNIKILSLQGESYFRPFTLLYKAHLPLLERLRIANHFYKISNNADCLDLNKVLCYPTVKVLILTGFRITKSLWGSVYGNWSLSDLSKKFPSLEYLFINDCDTLYDNIASIHTCWPNMQRIVFLGCKHSYFTGTVADLNTSIGWDKYTEGENIYIHYGS